MNSSKTKVVAKMKVNLTPMIEYCHTIAKCAEFESKSIENVHDVYKNTMAIGLFAISRNILLSTKLDGPVVELNPIRDALADLACFQIPVRLLEMANFFGNFQTEMGIVKIDRINDVILRLIEIGLMVLRDPNFDAVKAAKIQVFYNTSQFKSNLRAHLNLQLDLLKNELVPSNLDELSKFDLVKQETLPCPTRKLHLIRKLADLEHPLAYSQKFQAIDVYMSQKLIPKFACELKECMKDLKLTTINCLKKLYKCTTYFRSVGSNMQILNKDELNSLITQYKIDQATAFHGLTLNGELKNFSIDESFIDDLEKSLKKINVGKQV